MSGWHHTGCGAYCDNDNGEPCPCCRLGNEVDSLRAGARVAQAAAGKRIAELTALLKAADDVVASQDRRIAAALGMLDAELKYERNLGRHLSLTQISDALRGGETA